MTLYKCPRCGYLAKQRTDLRRHFSRKTICTNIYANTSIEECFRTILNEENSNSLRNPEKNDDFYEKTLRNPEKNANSLRNPEKFFNCIYCKKIFTRKDNLKVHVEKYCRKKVVKDENFNEIEDLKMEIEKLKSENKKYKIGVQNNHQINNIQNNNIIINAFGKENLDYITKDFIHRIVSEGPYGSIQKLIKHIHFNPNHKENQNIKIPNKRDKFGMVFDGTKWLWKNKQSMINEIAGNAFDLITDHCEDLTSKKYDKFCIEFENKQVDCMKRIITDTELLILNYQTE